MPKYIRLEDVKLRTIGKVRFTTDAEDENKMPEALAVRLINEAEGQVELDLSPRYWSPFTCDEALGDGFEKVSDNARNIVRTLCEMQSVIFILRTHFGSGTAVDGEKYTKSLEVAYNKIVEKLLKKKTDGGVEAAGWMYPPLPGLRLNYMNQEADDGFHGRIYNTGSGDSMGYPQSQVNDPALGWFNWGNWIRD